LLKDFEANIEKQSQYETSPKSTGFPGSTADSIGLVYTTQAYGFGLAMLWCMTKLATTFLCLLVCTQAHAVDLNEGDKNLHMGLSYNLTAAGTHSLQQLGVPRFESALLSGGFVLVLGVLKEFVVDQVEDGRDIQADVYGTALGMVVPFQIEF
jgi:hypothetical protein